MNHYTLGELYAMMRVRDELNAHMLALILGQGVADAYRDRVAEIDLEVERQRG